MVVSRRVSTLVACAALCSMQARAQQPSPIFRSSNQTVAVYATVRDRATGRLVTNLDRDAFEVIDNGKPADITVFSNQPQPVAVVMMIDLSSGMWPWLDLTRRAGEAFVSALGPTDVARIGSLSGRRISISPDFTNDRVVLNNVLREELWPAPGSPVWNGVDAAMSALAERPERHVVLALSEGDDNESLPGFARGFGNVRSRAESEDVMVYVIGRPGLPLDRQTRELAEISGGGHFELKPDADLQQTLKEVANELHQQYLVGFTPSVLDGKSHSLVVRSNRPGLTVRARTGYVAVRR